MIRYTLPLILLFPLTTNAALYTGSLDSECLDTTNWDSFTISWEITQVDGGYYYKYCLSAERPELSHFILEVTQGCDFPIYSQQDFEGPRMFETHEGDIFGIKFDESGPYFSFWTTRAPVWGTFFAKGGHTSWATTGDCLIARPNGDLHITPEPGSLALLGAGLGVVALRRRKTQAYS